MLERKKTTLFACLAFTVIAMLTCVTGFAEEPDEDPARHIPIGSRQMSVQDIQEVLLQQVEKSEVSQNEESETLLPMSTKSFFSAASYPGSIHHITFRAPGGFAVELEDGSIWRVCDADAPYVGNWLAYDDILIYPDNIPYLAYYTYSDPEFYGAWGSARLVNMQTNTSVQVSMKMGPFFDSPWTRWIVAICYETMELWLNDGSHWNISNSDWSVFRKFQPNDTIIIGTNDDWSSYSVPNMLINVNMYSPYYKDIKPWTSRVRAVQTH